MESHGNVFRRLGKTYFSFYQEHAFMIFYVALIIIIIIAQTFSHPSFFPSSDVICGNVILFLIESGNVVRNSLPFLSFFFFFSSFYYFFFLIFHHHHQLWQSTYVGLGQAEKNRKAHLIRPQDVMKEAMFFPAFTCLSLSPPTKAALLRQIRKDSVKT